MYVEPKNDSDNRVGHIYLLYDNRILKSGFGCVIVTDMDIE